MKVYISAPISIPWETVLKVRDNLVSTGIGVSVWNRGTKYSISISDYDAIVFILPNMKWQHTINGLPSGIKSEVSRAVFLNKPIYIAYTPINESTPTIYNAKHNLGIITGIQGTGNSIHKTQQDKEIDTELIEESDTTIVIHKPKEVSESNLMMLLIGRTIN